MPGTPEALHFASNAGQAVRRDGPGTPSAARTRLGVPTTTPKPWQTRIVSRSAQKIKCSIDQQKRFENVFRTDNA
jgi:hypothetical protein